MANERNTENLVRKLLAEQGYMDNPNVIVEEQSSDNPKIDKLLGSASKSGKGKGYPEFIITFKDKPENIIVIECKASLNKHESKDKKQYKDYAVDGALLYASYLKDDFNVVAIGVSGETEREMKISHFVWLKDKHIYKDITDKNLLTPDSVFQIVKKQSAPLKEEELIKKAIEYNDQLHGYSIPEVDRCTVISSILVALQDIAFTNSFEDFHNYEEDDGEEDEGKKYNPNKDLIKALLDASERVLKKNKMDTRKSETILAEYGKITSNLTLNSRTITVKRKTTLNTVLRDLILDIKTNIMPYIEENVYDVLGLFYTQFIRYAGSDSKTGLVLTPAHITDLFCDLAEITKDDIIFDPCCGTGGFLVSSMKYMLEKAGNNQDKQKEIKSKQLIGIEKRADMFSHACSNMMMRGDGKSHIYFNDCFNKSVLEKVKNEKPTKALLNPPYDVGEDGQLEFIDNALDCLVKDGICIAICQMSVAVSSKSSVIEVRKRLLEKHTLEAVLSMPDDLFYPVGVVTCILVFKAHTPHPETKKSFFGYFKDDGFIKVKNKGRIDTKETWKDTKSKWLSAYVNRENIAGLSVTQSITPEDEWCAEAYMETDYSTLTQEDFEDVVKNYTLFKLMNGGN